MPRGDNIFMRDEKGHLLAQNLHPFSEGLDGVRLEEALQKLIANNPTLLPGDEIEPGSENPPRFALLGKEVSIGGWSLDLLLVDQNGILTLIETKLVKNREARRDVIGQILDYAASARESWQGGKLRTIATALWQGRREDLDEHLRRAFTTEDVRTDESFSPEDYWDLVEKNLQDGRLRLIIASDELRPEVRRVIEYLNEEMRTADIFGLEVRCYGEEERLVVVPYLVGQTQRIVESKRYGRGQPIITWSAEKLREAYLQFSDPKLGLRLTQILDWAIQNRCFIEVVSQTPGFWLRGKTGLRFICFYSTGYAYVVLQLNRYNSPEERNRFITELNQLSAFNYSSQEVEQAIDGRQSKGTIANFTDEELRKLLELLSQYCGETS